MVRHVDKANTAVLIYEQESIRKAEEFLTENDTTEVLRNPTDKFQAALRKKVDSSHFLLNDYEKKSVKMTEQNPTNLDLK